jgi:hypothetical protein
MAMPADIHSPANAHLTRIAELAAEVADLREACNCYEAMKAGVTVRIADLEALAARQARQITEQAFHIGSLTKQLSAAHEEATELRRRMPRPPGKRYSRMGEP